MKVFYEITLQILGTQYCTKNTYFEKVIGLFMHLCKVLDESIGCIACNGDKDKGQIRLILGTCWEDQHIVEGHSGAWSSI